MSRILSVITIVICACFTQGCCYKADCSSVGFFSIPVECSRLSAGERSHITVYTVDKVNGNMRDSSRFIDAYTLYLPVFAPNGNMDSRNYNYIIKLATGRQDTIYNVNYELGTYHCNSCLWSKGTLAYNFQNPEYWYKQQQYTNGTPVILQP